MNLPFDFPRPSGFTSAPIWTGESFLCGDKEYKVLEYSENFAGWSDDLTALHEEALGDGHPIDVASRNDAIQQVLELAVQQDKVVLEIGCSSGFLIRELHKQLKHAIIIGADVVKSPLYKLADALPGVPLIRFDLLQNPLPKECVDVLVMLNVLEHIEDDVLALENAFQLLKPGASLVIEVPAGRYLYDAYDAQLHHYRRYSVRELQSKLELAGFVVTRKSHLGFFLFPAFALVKLANKFRGDSRSVVKNQASSTSNSRIVSMLMSLESRLSRFLSFPFGIRILVTAKRPV